MGYEFAQTVNTYLELNGYPTHYIAKINSNPAKSKHLETATTKLYGQEIDFCNLRTEVYSENSRIPTEIKFGTPSEDAYRRDITINSLFYNVCEKLVEDFTQQGLPDLTNGLIRTPLAPYETFRDDPLRVLRCIRFASRFGFGIVPELGEAAKNPDIKDALSTKISKERIGIELDKMLSGPSPLHSLKLLYSLDLYPVVFAPPANIVSGSVKDSSMSVRAAGIIQWYESQLYPKSLDEQRLLYLGATVLPFSDLVVEKKKRPIPAIQIVLRDSIRSSNVDINAITTLFQGIPQFRDAAQRHQQECISRSDLGMIIRRIGSLWPTAVKMALTQDLLDNAADISWEQPESLPANSAQDICQKYEALTKQAEAYGIQDCYDWKHIVDGNATAALLGIRPGPVVAELLQVMMRWQLQHPEGTPDQCADMIKQYWQEHHAN
ncbi:uncharacterized protein BYT42DRAFT_487526 [Radiomyces spectabilis]|uniref:uncharacterized protein n=1 Tax=Radiomyces spectabilis TaxID=64574 RepID=UPI00222019C9|nr:uncharacterized protein BYT42DRAFT_487526 [Radiomyces spectabilis]KAI8394255.1 hypothetical protein BYT42DRAFT_487526 [Radiomyces spectabilis]